MQTPASIWFNITATPWCQKVHWGRKWDIRNTKRIKTDGGWECVMEIWGTGKVFTGLHHIMTHHFNTRRWLADASAQYKFFFFIHITLSIEFNFETLVIRVVSPLCQGPAYPGYGIVWSGRYPLCFFRWNIDWVFELNISKVFGPAVFLDDYMES